MTEVKSGIYKITNTYNGKFYIGSAKDLHKRRMNHFSQLRKGNHGNRILQNAFNKYGESCFTFEILELCEPEKRLEIEQVYLDKYNPVLNVSKFSTGGERIKPELRKLTDDDVVDILKSYSEGESTKSLLKRFGLKGRSTIPGILNRTIYWSVPVEDEILEKIKNRRLLIHEHDRKLNEKDVLAIINLFCLGFTKTELSKLYRLSKATVGDVLKRKSYQEVKLSAELEERLSFLIRNKIFGNLAKSYSVEIVSVKRDVSYKTKQGKTTNSDLLEYRQFLKDKFKKG